MPGKGDASGSYGKIVSVMQMKPQRATAADRMTRVLGRSQPRSHEARPPFIGPQCSVTVNKF